MASGTPLWESKPPNAKDMEVAETIEQWEDKT